ncbi:SEL1-like repeat protein [Actinomadura welshii]|uniref:SEL1-like repeat protein n=1 Tax=Actinomadura welshii TaxID=3103817 RepID=UPI0003AD6D43|nr:tetratricopeptide repeat protein [Actinomadura madurae]
MSGYPAESIDLYEDGLEARKAGHPDDAKDLFRRAFEAGHPGGAHELGMLASGRGEDDRAVEWWTRAAGQGYAPSAFEAGYAAERAGDRAAAERWYRQAAEGGHSGGPLNLGVLAENDGDREEAIRLYRQAWDLGADQAGFNIGRLYDNDGKGDLDAAETWYSRAAERGNGGAAFNLGFVREDRGDRAGKLEAWRRAAELRHPRAALCLGVDFAEAGDEDTAVAWLRRAVLEVGSENASHRLRDIHRGRGDGRGARFWSEFLTGLSVYSPEFEAFGAYGSAAAIHRQDVLIKALGDGYTSFDLDERTLSTGGRTFHGVTFLGSYSHVSRTWKWAWDNPHFEQDSPAIAPLRAIRDHGDRQEIPELMAGGLDLSGFPNPHQAATTMAIAAAAVLGGNGVHSCRVNDGQGSFYFHLDDPSLPAAGFDPITAPRVLMTAAEVFPADPRRVVLGFLDGHGFRIRMSADTVDGTSPDGARVTVAFTPEGLIKAMTVGRGDDG